MKQHKKSGLNVVGVHVENQFNAKIIVDSVRLAILNACTENEYVGISERRVRIV